MHLYVLYNKLMPANPVGVVAAAAANNNNNNKQQCRTPCGLLRRHWNATYTKCGCCCCCCAAIKEFHQRPIFRAKTAHRGSRHTAREEPATGQPGKSTTSTTQSLCMCVCAIVCLCLTHALSVLVSPNTAPDSWRRYKYLLINMPRGGRNLPLLYYTLSHLHYLLRQQIADSLLSVFCAPHYYSSLHTEKHTQLLPTLFCEIKYFFRSYGVIKIF